MDPRVHAMTRADLIDLFGPVVVEGGNCRLCVASIRGRILEITNDWSLVRDTI